MFWGQEALSSDSDFATCHVCETLGKLILLLLGLSSSVKQGKSKTCLRELVFELKRE